MNRITVRKVRGIDWGASCPACPLWGITTGSWSLTMRAADAHRISHRRERWRCCIVGCNPKLWSMAAAEAHRIDKAHRVARWPVRSAEGERKQRERNRAGYYRRYSTRPKWGGDDRHDSPEALGQD